MLFVNLWLPRHTVIGTVSMGHCQTSKIAKENLCQNLKLNNALRFQIELSTGQTQFSAAW
jgi:hypothetical protein